MKNILQKMSKFINKYINKFVRKYKNLNLSPARKTQIFIGLFFLFLVIFGTTTYFITYSDLILDFKEDPEFIESGLSGNKVYINDIENDYNYYMGLNYTSSNGTLPTIQNKNIYNDNNLVQTKIKYLSDDENNHKGYVSLNERQDTFIYFNIYPVNNNGTPSNLNDDYILITLIDNPFTDRPNDKAFNGWFTNYPGAYISFSKEYYERYAKVPVTYTENKPNKIDITFNASYTKATKGEVTRNSNLTGVINDLKEDIMHKLETLIIKYGDFDMDGYFREIKLGFLGDKSGYYDNKGKLIESGVCWGECFVYEKIVHENFVEGNIYFEVKNKRMTQVDNSTLDRPIIDRYEDNSFNNGNMSSFYRKKKVAKNKSIDGLYDNNGYQVSGNCTNGNGCTYYELIQYSDTEIFDKNKEYYYLTTRDTNIVLVKENISGTWDSSINKPFTMTSLYNGTKYNATWHINSAVDCYNDFQLENITTYYSGGLQEYTPSSDDYGVLYGNYHNVKLGRGLTRNGNNANFKAVVAGNNSTVGSQNSPKKYKFILESGLYNSISLSSPNTFLGTRTTYIQNKSVYGSDYDRINNKNNLLDIYFCASGSWGNYIKTSGGNNTDTIAIDLIVKSGTFGSGKRNYDWGIYVAGRSRGEFYAPTRIKVDGGYIYNLVGGPTISPDRSSRNAVYINVNGGTVEMISGGAGRSETWGNRIIAVTGGTINYSVFGGSNGVDGSASEGTLTGSPYIYVGGNAVIGNDNNINTNGRIYGAESGSVFGIGNGSTKASSIGSADNSIIIIDGKANIKNNIYGGGNFGATGISSRKNTTNTNIIINNGIINGSVYGGGNKNGSGSETITSTIDITMNGGHVLGSIYGGSNEYGTIYGSANINIFGGEVNNNVYGGGRGGYVDASNTGTFVRDNVNVVVGTNNNFTPLINGSVYGGSAFGTVNGTTNNASVSSSKTNVTINKGIISNVFGGGQGDNTYRAYVLGDILVNINGGDIANVYGGNDKNGVPNGKIEVYINNGKVGNVFGGGNETSAPTTNVYQTGGTVTRLFGGSNLLGEVNTSNVIITGGTTDSIFGGNNEGGTTNTTNVTINGGNSNYVYGGGEKTSVLTSTNVNINSNTNNVFGGSNTSGNIPVTNVHINNGTNNNIFGGNNKGGVTNTSNVNINGGVNTSVYGGGLEAETPITNVNLKGGTTTNIYGGGNKAGATTTNINLGTGTSTNVYGGSNLSGNVPNSYIKSIDGNPVYQVTNLYGGNNQGGITTTTHIDLNRGEINNLYGGGNKAVTGDSQINLNTVHIIDNLYGGGNEAKITRTLVNINNSTFGTDTKDGNIYGGGNAAPVIETTTLNINNNTKVFGNVFGGGNKGDVLDTTNTKIDNSTVTKNIYGAGNQAKVGSDINKKVSNVTLTATTASNVYGGGNAAPVNGNTNLIINSSTITEGAYGGGNGLDSIVPGDISGEQNKAQVLASTNILVDSNSNIKDVYGGGNLGKVFKDTNVTTKIATINNSIYGGGNAAIVGGSSNVYVSGTTVNNSVYAGGNGIAAVLHGNTNLDIDNNSTIKKHVFGGGNAAPTGTKEANNSNSIVNIAGASIRGNVYGGANTSVLYGIANVNIGKEVITNKNLIITDINIDGTVFGGGEANASGSENYDFSFISVTTGINININALNHTHFNIKGSIFGSGNASSTEGYSYINIDNYGTLNDIKKNISIQRADTVKLNNSFIELSGAVDRTNEYSKVKFTLSRIDELKLINNSSIYLEKGANLLKKFTSLALVDGQEVKAVATIDEKNKTITRNVNNRVYMLEGENLNIALDQSVKTYGDVSGMTFFGMYNKDKNSTPVTALYSNHNYNDSVSLSDLYYFSSGSYVLGKHYRSHDITKDGFYTNYGNKEGTNIEIKYIEPTPDNSDFYMWSIGAVVASYDISMIASKYLTLGSVELSLLNHAKPNTIFTVLGANYNDLDPSIKLVDYKDIPRIAANENDANTIFGLNMKSGQSGFVTNGSTSFVTEGTTDFIGTKDYKRENTSTVPSLVFYFYHSKNITTEGHLGTVTISLAAITPKDDLNNEVEKININIDLSKALFDTNDYEGTITPGKKYELFATSNANITTKSTFSTYYSLFVQSDKSPYKKGYHRNLLSTYLFPVNTKITMIDLHDETKPVYYYYVINQNDYNIGLNEYNRYGEVTYKLSKFIKMGSTSPNNNYDDNAANKKYYKNKIATEEFIFMVDFKDANINEDVLNKKLLIELRNSEDQIVASVLGVAQDILKYNLYNNSEAKIELSGNLSNTVIYKDASSILRLNTKFTEKKINSNIVYDTKYDSEKLGIKLSILDSKGNILNSSSLMGINYNFDGNIYYPRHDGTTRINIAESIANTANKIVINTTNSRLPTGEYTLLIESFGSPDGIYYGTIASDSLKLKFNIVDTIYGLSLTSKDIAVVDKVTGFTSGTNNSYNFTLNYNSTLDNPNIRMKLYRRNYDTVYSNLYEEVNLDNYFTGNFTSSNNANEYILSRNPITTSTHFIYFKENLISGTYRLAISLYDNDTYIGEIYKYIIIK